jgi:hypothetical protein
MAGLTRQQRENCRKAPLPILSISNENFGALSRVAITARHLLFTHHTKILKEKARHRVHE